MAAKDADELTQDWDPVAPDVMADYPAAHERLRAVAPVAWSDRWGGFYTLMRHADVAAASRDPAVWTEPDRFDPARKTITAPVFGGGVHFCVGAPLARLEMQVALPILFDRMPSLHLADTPRYANSYHFPGLETLHLAR